MFLEILQRHGAQSTEQLRGTKERQAVLDDIEAALAQLGLAQSSSPAVAATSASSQPAPQTPAKKLERLKVIVEHLYDTWPHLLRRQLTMQSLGRREDLHRALEQTYTAHIT